MLAHLLTALLLPAAPAPKYPVAAIEPALRTNAHAVIRVYDETVTVKSVRQVVETVHQAVTVLDETGSEEYGQLVMPYGERIGYLRGAVYDANGQLLHQLRPAEIHDQGMGGISGDLATSLRLRWADLRQPTYPYTVEFDYELITDNTLFYPGWQPQHAENVSLEASSLRVVTPTSLPLRYDEQQLPAGATHAPVTAENQTTYLWTLASRPAVEAEPLSPPLRTLLPAVRLAPASFKVLSYAGSQATWQDVGQWVYQLGQGRDQLPPDLVAQMAQLKATTPDPRERARKVYELVQRTTRYVSVQLGIGGWQTAPASSVASSGYGDCKALSNYTGALLRAAGLPAYMALVGAGADEPDVRVNFPSGQFNHAILCMPLAAQGSTPADTVWLECTSQTEAFGYMGSFTGNRHALLLTPEGGRLVATPRYAASANRVQRRTDLWVAADGNAKATVRTRRVGLAQERYAHLLYRGDPAEQKKYVSNHLPLSHFTLGSLRLSAAPATGSLPAVDEAMSLELSALATTAGRRLLLSPNLLSQLSPLPAQVGPREAPVALPSASLSQDTVRLHLPAGFKVESLPAPVEVTTNYGTYRSTCTALPDGTLQYVRQLELRRPGGGAPLPAGQYTEYREFRRKVSQADRAQLVLVKTEA